MLVSDKDDTGDGSAGGPFFTLAVVVSSDGFIARHHDDSPATWASPEEQVLFFRDVDAADWAVMGRNTHLAADRPNRRRVVFSSSTPEANWRRPSQVWINPAGFLPRDLPALVSHIRPMRTGLILGGTRVHDWFLEQGAIHRLHLTIEPVRFGAGLPVFSNQSSKTPREIVRDAGFAMQSDEVLNQQGSRYQVWLPV